MGHLHALRGSLKIDQLEKWGGEGEVIPVNSYLNSEARGQLVRLSKALLQLLPKGGFALWCPLFVFFLFFFHQPALQELVGSEAHPDGMTLKDYVLAHIAFSALEWFVLIGHSLFKFKCSVNTECGPFSGLFCPQPGTLVYKICMCLRGSKGLKSFSLTIS